MTKPTTPVKMPEDWSDGRRMRAETVHEQEQTGVDFTQHRDHLQMTASQLVQEVHRMTADLQDRPLLHLVIGILAARVRDPAERDKHLRQVAQDIKREFGFDQ